MAPTATRLNLNQAMGKTRGKDTPRTQPQRG